MSTSPRSEPGVSRVIDDESQRFLRVTRDHAISEAWLIEYEPGLYDQWLRATAATARDEIAATIDRRFDAIEFPTSGTRRARPNSPPPTESSPPSAEDRLQELVEEYETRLIGTGEARDSLPEWRAHIGAHIGWNELEQSRDVIAWRLRDWAEHAAPELLTAWQRDVLAYGDLDGGVAHMAAIVAAHSASRAEDDDTEPSPGRQAQGPTMTRSDSTVQRGSDHLRAVEAVPARPLRAVPSSIRATPTARAARAKVVPVPSGRPMLHGLAPSRAPHR